MTIEPLVTEDTLIRINRRIDNMAVARQMNRNDFIRWSDNKTYLTEISEDEALLIKAYQVDKARQILNSKGKSKLASRLEKDYWWVKRFKADFDIVDKAIKHLIDVCSYVQDNYEHKYYYEWLLSYDGDLADLMTKKSKDRSGKYKLDM